MGVGAPSGTVTFLFTDIEGSTTLWQSAPDAMREALERHDAILRSVIDGHGGYVFSTGGDGFAVAFARSGDAVAAGMAAQAVLAAERWPEGAPIRVRMGVHTGEAEERDGDYFGPPVNRTARLMAVGHGGQVLVSAVTAGLLDPQVVLVDLGDHRLRDLSAAQRIFQLGDGRFPPLRSVDAVPGNLPTMLTGLVGRDEDVADLVGLIERERMVTLTGVGGVGKTSMALAGAAASTGSFEDGCWFAELAPTATADEVVRAVASGVGAPAVELEDLSRFLAGRRMLIVLDNCEHVLSDAARLTEAVLGAGREAVILATSREPLGVRGEVVRGVRSLSVPGADASVGEALEASAVGLFVARATSASDRFVLDESNLEAVVEICGQLDGIPLAIELAAARVRAMSPAEISRRLSERFRLLTANKASLERHRTLLGAVSWSHDLLSDEERTVFRRLAVFPSSFDLAAAEAVAGDDDALDAVDCVLRLVDRSLVVYDPEADRYRMLETLREYATDRLADAGEIDLAGARHADCYIRLAAEHPFGSDRWLVVDGFDRLAGELDNFRAAAGWLSRGLRWGELIRLCRNLFTLGASLAPAEWGRWYDTALEHLPDLDTQERIDALGDLDALRMTAGSFIDDSRSGAGIALAEETGLLHAPPAWLARAVTINALGGPGAAKAASEMMLAAAQARGDEQAAVMALGLLACYSAALGDIDASEEFGAEALRRARLFRSPGMYASTVTAVVGSYLTNRLEPDFSAAMRLLTENHVGLEQITTSNGLWVHRLWGLACLGLGDCEPAVRHLARSFRITDETGQMSMQGEAMLALAVAVAEAGRVDLAAELLGYAEGHFVSTDMRDISATWLRARLEALDGVGTPGWAAALAAGARLDRRGFMRRMAEVERLASEQKKDGN